MNLKLCLQIIAFTFVTIASCKGERNSGNPQQSIVLELKILGNSPHQVIHGFGASDAWSCQFVGANWPDEKKEQIADWLFSTAMDENSTPLGIGLNMWRFNIGAGSAAQRRESGIRDEWRRAESFMIARDSFDWSKQSGQRWFLRAAKERGVEHFIGFVNSPPVALTKNGKAFSSDKENYNLPEENYMAFAGFLADVVENVHQNDGVFLNYISPFNEPQWDWIDGGQEGTPEQNSQIAAATRVINEVFEQRNVKALLEIPETAQYDYLYQDGNRPGRGSQIYSFFNPESPYFLGDLSKVAPKIAAHSYFTTWPLDKLVESRRRVHQAVKNNPRPIEFWMTEYCILENNAEIRGNGKDLGMDAALYMARVMFADLVFANAQSWQWWLGVSPYNYKDGLVYIDLDKNDGAISDSKMLWAMGHFSRFVKPGMKRVDVLRNDKLADDQTLDGLMGTAFVSNDGNECTLVVINYTENEASIRMQLDKVNKAGRFNVFVTDGNNENNLSFAGNIKSGELFSVPPRSLVTITNVN